MDKCNRIKGKIIHNLVVILTGGMNFILSCLFNILILNKLRKRTFGIRENSKMLANKFLDEGGFNIFHPSL